MAKDRVRRPIKPPIKFSDYTQFAFALITSKEIDVDEEPSCFHDAKIDKNCDKWNGRILKEMNSLLKNETWDIVD